MSEQNITIYVNEKGIIENPTEEIVSENVTITIDITSEVKKIIANNNIKISFCDGFLKKNNKLKFLEFVDDDARVQIIGNDFLSDCSNLTNITFSGLSKVTQIENSFLSGCANLTYIDLSPLSKLTQIDDYFLSACYSLENIDNLHVLSNVTQIGKSFLAGCGSLQKIDISGFSKVTQIKDAFLGGCSSLTNIDFKSLSSVKEIKDSFLIRCEGLINIDLLGLSSVTKIGNEFLDECVNLENINFSGLINITQIGFEFLDFCYSLEKIQILPHQKFLFKLIHDRELQWERRGNISLKSKLEINANLYNTPEGKKWIQNTIQQFNNIQDSDILLDIIDFL
jgi:hypothetical protein